MLVLSLQFLRHLSLNVHGFPVVFTKSSQVIPSIFSCVAWKYFSFIILLIFPKFLRLWPLSVFPFLKTSNRHTHTCTHPPPPSQCWNWSCFVFYFTNSEVSTEFKIFFNQVPTVLYHGQKGKRVHLVKRIRRRYPIREGVSVQPVVITSYEIAMIDRRFLAGHDWKYLIVDEGHRIKNTHCRLIR